MSWEANSNNYNKVCLNSFFDCMKPIWIRLQTSLSSPFFYLSFACEWMRTKEKKTTVLPTFANVWMLLAYRGCKHKFNDMNCNTHTLLSTHHSPKSRIFLFFLSFVFNIIWYSNYEYANQWYSTTKTTATKTARIADIYNFFYQSNN